MERRIRVVMSIIRVYICPLDKETKNNPYPIKHEDYECIKVIFDSIINTATIIGGEHDGKVVYRCCGVKVIK